MATARLRPALTVGLAVTAAAALWGSAGAQPQACAGAVRLNVVVEGVRSTRGDLVLEVYRDEPRGFLNERGRVERRRQKAEAPMARACLSPPAPGAYAVVVYHDENGDERFNRSLIGVPSEGFGLSNNVRPRLGPPSLRSVLIQAPDGETTVRVQMQYLSGERG